MSIEIDKNTKKRLKKALFPNDPLGSLYSESMENSDKLETTHSKLDELQEQQKTSGEKLIAKIESLESNLKQSNEQTASKSSEPISTLLGHIQLIRGQDGKDADEERIIQEVLSKIPLSKDGKDADSEAIIREVLSKIVLPEPKEAESVDIEKIVGEVLKRMPKPRDGHDGRNGTDGVNPDPKDVIELLKTLPEKDKLQLSHLRNGQELQTALGKLNRIDGDGFMFNGKKYKFEELMHGGGGNTLTVSDGMTTVTPVTEIDFTGATVTDGGNGVADVTISGGGGSPASPNLSVQYNNAGSFGGAGILYDDSYLGIVPAFIAPDSAGLAISDMGFSAGNATAGSNVGGGTGFFTGGNGDGSGSGGAVFLGSILGTSLNGGDTGAGGVVIVAAGTGGATSGDGGGVEIFAGNAQGGGNGGNIALFPGVGVGNPNGAVQIFDPVTSNEAIFDASVLSGNQTFTFPDATGTFALQTAASGTFTTTDSKTVTVVNGIITSIV